MELKLHQQQLIYGMAARVFLAGGPYLDRASLPLFADMGTGKTPAVIRLLQSIRLGLPKEFLWLPVLIICPNAVKYNWLHEFKRWAPEIVDSMLLVIDGGPAERESQLRYLKEVKPFYAIVNYDLVRIHRQFFQDEMGFLAVVCDEAHAIKNRRAKRTTAVKAIKSRFRIALTGTRITNKPDDLWSILDWLFPGEPYQRVVDRKARTYHHPGPWGSYDSFIRQYCEVDRRDRVLRGKNLSSLHNRLMDVGMVRWNRDEVLRLEPIVYRYVLLTPTPEQRQLYDELRRGFAQMVSPMGTLTRRQVGTILGQLTYLRRATTLTPREFAMALGGHNPTFAPHINIPISNRGAKIDWLFNFMDGYLNDGKMVVFCDWTAATRPLLARLNDKGIGALGIEGSTSSKQRFEIQERFNRDPRIKVLVGSPAAYEGLNLQAGKYVVFLNLPWAPKSIFQAYSRVHRLGQMQQVTVIFLCLVNTIDERMAEVLGRKQKDIDRAIDGSRIEATRLFDIRTSGDVLRLI